MVHFRALLFLNIVIMMVGCQSPTIPVPDTEEEKGVVALNIFFSRTTSLAKVRAIVPEDTTITLDTMFIQFVSNVNDTIRDTLVAPPSLNIRDNVIVPTRYYTLEALRTWNMKIAVFDTSDSLIYYTNNNFKVYPADTTLLNGTLQPRYTIFVARFLSTNNSITKIKKLELKIDSVVVATHVFSPKQRIFDEYLAYKYLRTGQSHFIEMLAYRNNTTVRYSASGNFTPVAGQDMEFTVPLN